MSNRIVSLLNIEKPFIQAPMSWVTNAEFVAAVSNAGGLGVLGPNAGQTTLTTSPEETAERMRQEIRKTKALTDKPFGVNLAPNADQAKDPWTRPILNVIKEEGVHAVVWMGMGEGTVLPEIFAELKQAGIKILYRAITPTVQNTRQAEEAGADIIVATGFDEGGLMPERAIGTFAIVPMIADAVRQAPVLAAGGIADARTAKAAFALGAEGIFVGTALLATHENPAHPKVKQALIDSQPTDLLLFRAPPSFVRSTAGKLAKELAEKSLNGADDAEISQRLAGLSGFGTGMMQGDLDSGWGSFGLGVGHIHRIKSVAEAMADMLSWQNT
ncbi:nitronate monooxygenase [Avibacterium sp. 20-15]|uniref:NAD(P)H-dependent flavin oxidoreductase n=1 Tax=unclassified Avibacterium TaxID=2685287 RepID=UPI00202740A7|nr:MULTISPECIES: nitronate monooxygenase [unclassified Avibacterium]MCW9733004.1 nitronate monooxygenase [Avibacterium sp. 20-15]URL05134.1 nitronate monooxygenase [Avibacterium sp. 20-132]